MPHPQDPELRCGTCVFWEPPAGDPADGFLGECRRSQPHSDSSFLWRATASVTWCGEHPRMTPLLHQLRKSTQSQDCP